MINKEDWGKVKSKNGKVKAAGKREQRKSSLLLCRAGAGSSARSAVKAESGKRKTENGKRKGERLFHLTRIPTQINAELAQCW